MGRLIRFPGALGVLVLLAGGLLPTMAQDTQLPVDRDRSVYAIDPALRNAAGLFPDVEGFESAVLYRTEKGAYELVVHYHEDGRTRRERRTLSAEGVRELRAEVSDGLTALQEPSSVTQEGRYGLLAATTFHGLVEGGLLAGATGAEGGSVTTTVFAGGTLGFFGPLLATRTARVTKAEADLTFYGGLQGYAHAVQAVGLLAGEDPDGRATAGLAALLGAAEGTAGYLTARRNDWTDGHGEMVAFTGAAGNLIGLGVGTAIVGEVDGRSGARRAVSGVALLGSVAGGYLGHRQGRTDRYTEGDAQIYLQTAVQGTNLAGSLLSVTDSDLATRALLVSGAATASGLLGRQLVRGRNFTGTQSGLVALGSVGGSLLGLALTSEAGSKDVVAVTQAMGSAVGFGVTYGVLEGEARGQPSPGRAALDVRVRVTPAVARGPGNPPGPVTDRLGPRLTLSATF